MSPRRTAGSWVVIALMSTLALTAAPAVAPTLRAQASTCTLLKDADVVPLLGPAPTRKDLTGNCTWKSADGKRKIYILKYRFSGPPAKAAFPRMKQAAASGGEKVISESGAGDDAFSSLTSFGVAYVLIKGGRLLQVQYWLGQKGTAADVAALRPLAKKAAAAY